MPDVRSWRGEFTSRRAQEVLHQACEVLELPGDGAELVRLGENAIYRLRAAPLVVRIGRSAARVPIMRRELCVASWLGGQGVPVTQPYGRDEPVLVDGHPVSVWHLVPPGVRRPGMGDLAALLRVVHSLTEVPPCDLSPLDPLTTVEHRAQSVTGLDAADRDFLLARAGQLRRALDETVFALPVGFVHGDAHTGNLLGEAGRAVLGDFEGAAIGPREWDLVTAAMATSRFGLPEAEYRTFVDVYGFDVTTWAGYWLMREARELYMITWLAQNLAEGPAVAAEVALRIASLRDGDTAREWHAF